MGKLTFDMSISLDGLIAGPGDHVERREPLARMAARRSPSSATGSRARSRRPGRPPATPTSRSRAANVIQQDLKAGLVDEFQLYFVPVVPVSYTHLTLPTTPYV